MPGKGGYAQLPPEKSKEAKFRGGGRENGRFRVLLQKRPPQTQKKAGLTFVIPAPPD